MSLLHAQFKSWEEALHYWMGVADAQFSDRARYENALLKVRELLRTSPEIWCGMCPDVLEVVEEALNIEKEGA